MKTEHTKHQRVALSLAERRHFLLTLKNGARRGDTLSMIGTLFLDQLSQLSQLDPRHTDSGVTNLPSGGWAGDANDPKAAIIATRKAKE